MVYLRRPGFPETRLLEPAIDTLLGGIGVEARGNGSGVWEAVSKALAEPVELPGVALDGFDRAVELVTGLLGLAPRGAPRVGGPRGRS